MKKSLWILFLLYSINCYSQNIDESQVLDGSKPFTLRFNFVRILNKSNGQVLNYEFDTSIRFIPGSIKGQGRFEFNVDGEIDTSHVYDIQPLMVEGIQHFTGFEKENGITIGAVTWSKIAFHSVDNTYTVSYGIKKR